MTFVMINDHTKMQPDDILEYRCPKFGIVTQWRVYEVRLGPVGGNSFVFVKPMNAPNLLEPIPVPEQLTRHLLIIRKEEAPQ